MNEFPVPLSPLAEQHRIVAKVDALMALCDQLQAAQTEREQSRDRLVAASLHRIGNTTQSRHSGRDCRTNPPGADLHPPKGCRAGQPGMNPEHRDVNLSDDPLFRFGSEHQSAEVMEAKPVYVPVNRIPAIPAGMMVTDSTAFILQLLPRITTRPAHIKQLRQTILNLAVRGKLVPQDPNDEPATELLKQIGAEASKTKNTRRLSENTNEKLSSPNSFLSNFHGTTVNCPIIA
jgi:type I restriction enzyme S subunit